MFFIDNKAVFEFGMKMIFFIDSRNRHYVTLDLEDNSS